MANAQRGEFRLVAGETTYTLQLTTNAACELEDRSGRLFDDIVLGTNSGSVRDLRWLLWASLQAQHGANVREPKDVGPIIDAAGGLQGVATQMAAFMRLNQEDAGESGGTADSGHPPNAGSTAPTGESSTSTPARTD